MGRASVISRAEQAKTKIIADLPRQNFELPTVKIELSEREKPVLPNSAGLGRFRAVARDFGGVFALSSLRPA